MEPSAWNHRLQRLAWLPIPLLLLAIGVFWVADLGAVYEPPYLMAALNLLFMLPVALFVAYQTGRSFLLRGHPGLLWFSCGILFWGSAGPLGGWLLPYGPGAVVTVHNILIGLAAVCHFAGVAFAPWLRPTLRWPEVWLAGAYAGVLTLIVVVVLETLSGGIPGFFIQGEGGTPLRQIMLGWAVALFVLTAIRLMRNPGGTRSAFQYWYALALLLIAIGSFGVMIQSNLGGPLGWTGRFAQYLGSIYLMVAAVVGMRENRDWGHLLEAALGEATRRFEELLSRYELVLAGAQDAIWDWDVIHQRVHFSPQWKAMRGYADDEVSDREDEWSAGIHPDDASRVFARLQEHFAGQTPVFAEEYRIQCKDGSWKWIFDRGLAQRDATGRVVRMAGSESDITERKRAETALRAALEEHEVLLREVHHRVKNNLTAIIGLLELQQERALDPLTVSQLEELGHRIRSMALIHEMLYQSSNLSRVDFRDYLEALVGHLRDALDPFGAIRIRITALKVWMNLDTAIPCGLIVNELITNALKYAFPDHRRAASACEIFIAAEWDGAAYTLTITDNGVGLPTDLDWTTTPTLGLRLIRLLGQHQLRGQLTVDGTQGTRVSLRFGPR